MWPRIEAVTASTTFRTQTQAVWDPKEKRPHMALMYCGAEASQPLEELLLDYDFATYWSGQVGII